MLIFFLIKTTLKNIKFIIIKVNSWCEKESRRKGGSCGKGRLELVAEARRNVENLQRNIDLNWFSILTGF